MKPLHLILLAFALLPAPPAAAQAPADVPPPNDDVANVTTKVEPPEEPGEGALILDLTLEAKTAYFFRGYNVMDAGYILQPEATLSLPALEHRDLTLSPYVGVWNNISEAKGPDSAIWSHWTEFDATAGVELSRGDWSLDLQYNYYLSPSDLFDSTHELGATLTYSADVLGLALSPHVALFRELHDLADGDENTYLEAGVEPGYEVSDQISVAFPLTVGMSLDSYYTDDSGHNEFLGYASIAARPAYQIDDHWSVYAGVEYLHLFADSAKAANGGDDTKFIGVVGVSFTH